MLEERRKKFLLFTGTAYGLFWGVFAVLLALILTDVLHISLEGESPFLLVMKVFFSWTPTMAVFIHLQRLCPGMTIRGFYKKVFGGHISWKMIAGVALLQAGMNVLAGMYVSLSDGVPFSQLWHFTWEGAFQSALVCMITGASGEESGWHGFLVPFLAEKTGLVSSGILVGLIWGFWHVPLWIISGYSGAALAFYIIEFLVCTIDWALIMGILYDWSGNLFIAVWFHFLVNYSLSFFVGNDLKYQISIAVLYTILAAVMSVITMQRKKSEAVQAGGFDIRA